ncbi:acyl-CoA dehydrogenase family protein [Cereibacter ovatus]|uniref:acyl-CoA dehydrogenase family protein n=1 Tax=Cereibacter ovatus TaxID=439529 RepID=UPI00195D14BE|nr:acyl-CoA dehydrogenase family protein [Cereibacter ovatus]
MFAKSSALGLHAMNIPKAHGGGGLSAFDMMLVEEQFGRTTDILISRAFGNVYGCFWPARAHRSTAGCAQRCAA